MNQLRRFFSYYKPYKALFLFDMAIAISSSILAIFFPALTRELLKTWIPQQIWRSMIVCFAAMFVIYTCQAIFTYIRVRWGHYLGVNVENDMRKDLFSHLQTLSFSYYDHTKTGHLMSRMTNDLFMIAEVAHHCPEDCIISVATIIGAYIVMFNYSVPMALISLIPMPFLIAWGILFGGKQKRVAREVRGHLADVNSNIENSVQGIREVKSFTSEKYQGRRFDVSNEDLRNSKNRQYSIMATYHGVMGWLRNLYYFTTVVGGAVLIYNGVIESYDLVAFLLYVSVVLEPIDRLINFVEQLSQGIAAFERFTEIMDEKPMIQDKAGAKDLEVSSGDIQYKNVRFTYDTRDGEVIGDISLDIKGGTTVAIVGDSGAGKSTIASLLPRFYEIDDGSIAIDGQDIRDITQSSLRRNIGFVQQSVFLFDADIRENLRYGNPDATDEQMMQALDAANLGEFVRSLPDGLSTQVGEHGTRLSGGQKQRISIARVFLKNPPILIFDEATSSLDNESERLIQDAFDRLSVGRTSIVIAHRLTTIKNADKIIVIDKGKVIETGTHDQLLQQNGHYARLYRGDFN
ncbi:MAG: ABC transporter ATP-binding protein/permease [Sphaerochaetaceae bacterium]|nr:ABC transporter ATP-binding protein/permease [Sphaerochaetaceae bacterium]